MIAESETVAPRSQVRVAVEPSLRTSLLSIANGRAVVIDYFASQRCSVVIGDLTVDLRAVPPGARYVELCGLDGVRVFAEERLLAILGDSGPTLRMAGPPFARHISVALERPERWIDFLETPGVYAGKRGSSWRRG